MLKTTEQMQFFIEKDLPGMDNEATLRQFLVDRKFNFDLKIVKKYEKKLVVLLNSKEKSQTKKCYKSWSKCSNDKNNAVPCNFKIYSVGKQISIEDDYFFKETGGRHKEKPKHKSNLSDLSETSRSLTRDSSETYLSKYVTFDDLLIERQKHTIECMDEEEDVAFELKFEDDKEEKKCLAKQVDVIYEECCSIGILEKWW